MLSAVAYCHGRSICHRDLKPENVLLEGKDLNVKIIDFGTAITYNPSMGMNNILGTPYYMAPEIYSGLYNEKCDIWSLGVILYILLNGSPPFGGNSDFDIMNCVKAGKYS